MAAESEDWVGEGGKLMIGGSVTVVAHVSDTLTSTVGLGMVVVVDSVTSGVENGMVEIGTEVLGDEGGIAVVGMITGGVSTGEERSTFCCGDGGGVGSVVCCQDSGRVGERGGVSSRGQS